MLSLVAAAALFAGIHLLVSGTAFRGVLTAKLGEGPYTGLFSLTSAGALGWLIYSYRPAQEAFGAALWVIPDSARFAVITLMFFAFLFVIVGLTTPSPTAAGQEGVLKKDEPATGVLRISRHPFLMGVCLWAVAHLIANPDLPSLVLFGGVGLVAVTGPRLIDQKRAAKFGPDWDRFAAKTSVIPFVAILQGRNRLALGEIGALRLGAGLVAWAATLMGHSYVFGVPALVM